MEAAARRPSLCVTGTPGGPASLIEPRSIEVPSQLAAGALAGRYVIERELGRGGMATVYLARDLKHDRLVAIKVLRAELAHVLGPERFLREVQIATHLQHPHILQVFDSGAEAPAGGADQCLWYAMPFI